MSHIDSGEQIVAESHLEPFCEFGRAPGFRLARNIARVAVPGRLSISISISPRGDSRGRSNAEAQTARGFATRWRRLAQRRSSSTQADYWLFPSAPAELGIFLPPNSGARYTSLLQLLFELSHRDTDMKLLQKTGPAMGGAYRKIVGMLVLAVGIFWLVMSRESETCRGDKQMRGGGVLCEGQLSLAS